MKNISFIVFILLINNIVRAQEFEIIGEKSYKVTSEIWLNYPGYNILKFKIAKETNGETPKIILKTSSGKGRFNGGIIILLDNGEILKCSNEELVEYVNSDVIIMFSVTRNELEKLINSNIRNIKFMLSYENYLAENTNTYVNGKINLPLEIKQLFNFK